MIPKLRTITFDLCEVDCGVRFPVEGQELPHQLPPKQAPWSRLPCRSREVQHSTLVLQGEAALLDVIESGSLFFQMQIQFFPKGVTAYPGI